MDTIPGFSPSPDRPADDLSLFERLRRWGEGVLRILDFSKRKRVEVVVVDRVPLQPKPKVVIKGVEPLDPDPRPVITLQVVDNPDYVNPHNTGQD